MTPKELSDALDELGWRQSMLTKKLGMSRTAVCLWMNGTNAVPGYVEEYVRVCLLARRILGKRREIKTWRA